MSKKGRKRRVDVSEEYRVLAKPEPYPISMASILDMMYSAFAFQVVQRFVLPMAQKQIYDNIKKGKIKMGLQKQAFIVFDEDVNEQFIHQEFASWILLQSKDRSNNNMFLPVKTTDTVFIREALKLYFLHRTRVISKKISDKEAESYSKKVLEKLKLDKLLPALNKRHTPPLMTKEAHRGYHVEIKSSKDKLRVVNTKGRVSEGDQTVVKISKKDNNLNLNLLNDVGIDEVFVGFRVQSTDDVVTLNFQMPLLDEEVEKLRDMFVPKGKISFEDIVFLLLTVYSGFGLLYRTPFARGLLRIADPRLRKLQSTATILIGTPFTVEKGRSYFSLFPNIEQHLGSMGSFFEAEPLTGTYSLLPPPTFVFISYCLDRVEKWLNDAKKDKRKLKIVFWYPHLYSASYIDPVDVEMESFDGLDPEQLIYSEVNTHLLGRLNRIKHKKQIINYAPDKKISNSSENFVFKVFVFES